MPRWKQQKRSGGMEGMKYRQQDIYLKAGDCLYLYTDGVTEAMNPEEQLYSDQRLLEVMNSGKLDDKTLEEQLHIIRGDISEFANGAEQADDITMLMLKIKEGGVTNG